MKKTILLTLSIAFGIIAAKAQETNTIRQPYYRTLTVNDVILDLPVQRPNVEAAVIELFLE